MASFVFGFVTLVGFTADVFGVQFLLTSLGLYLVIFFAWNMELGLMLMIPLVLFLSCMYSPFSCKRSLCVMRLWLVAFAEWMFEILFLMTVMECSYEPTDYRRFFRRKYIFERFYAITA
jgi:hypothetical protein